MNSRFTTHVIGIDDAQKNNDSLAQQSSDILFISIPRSQGSIASVETQIRSLIDNALHCVFIIPDTEQPTELPLYNPILLALQRKYPHVHVFQSGCRANIHRILAALRYQQRGVFHFSEVAEGIARQYEVVPRFQAECHRSVAEYDAKLAGRKDREAYQATVERLEAALDHIVGLHIAFDLEGTLVGSNLALQNPLMYSSYVLRPFANEVMRILSRKNKISLCTLASLDLFRAIREQTGLVLPKLTKVVSNVGIKKVNRSRGIQGKRVKIPELFGYDVLIDDVSDKHIRRCIEVGFPDQAPLFIGIKSFDYNGFSDLETCIDDTGFLNLEPSLTARFNSIQSR